MYLTIEDYGFYDHHPSPVSAEEREAFRKIYHTAANKGLNVGDVRGYLCTPDGDPIVLITGELQKDLAIFEGFVKKQGTPKGKPVVPPRSQIVPDKAEADTLALHLTARMLPIMDRGGEWGSLPGEDWILYTRKEWTQFLPPADATAGTSWNVDRDIAIKLLSHFYPATEEYGYILKAEYEKVSIKATLVSENRVHLDVSLRMKEKFINMKQNWMSVEATAVGVVDINPAKKTIKRFVMATQKAKVDGSTFGVAVRSVP